MREIVRVVFRAVPVIRGEMNNEIADVGRPARGRAEVLRPRFFERNAHVSLPLSEGTPSYIGRNVGKIDLVWSIRVKFFRAAPVDKRKDWCHNR